MSRGQVCMLAYTLYPYDNRVQRAAETVANDGYAVRVLTLKTGPTPKSYESSGVQVQELSVAKYQGDSSVRYTLSYIQFTVLAFFSITRACLKRQVDVVHVHNLPDFILFAAIVPRLLGKKLILDVHDSVPETYSAKFDKVHPVLYRLLCLEERVCCGMAHVIVCVNDVQRDTLVDRGIPLEKTRIVINSPNPKYFKPQADRSGDPDQDGHFRLGYHGTLSHRLGVDLTVEAVSRLRDSIPGISLHLWGAGDGLRDLEKAVAAREASDLVTFHGVAPIDSIATQLGEVDVGVIANRSGIATRLMLPVKMMEYVALGVPVIVPRMDAIEHYFTDDMVTFFEPENVESLMAAITELYRNPAVRQEKADKARGFLDRFGYEQQEAEIVRIYEELGARKTREDRI